MLRSKACATLFLLLLLLNNDLIILSNDIIILFYIKKSLVIAQILFYEHVEVWKEELNKIFQALWNQI